MSYKTTALAGLAFAILCIALLGLAIENANLKEQINKDTDDLIWQAQYNYRMAEIVSSIIDQCNAHIDEKVKTFTTTSQKMQERRLR